MSRRSPERLRSHRWFGASDLRAFGHRSRARQQGFSPEDWSGKPVIAIVNTWSDANPCHAHLRQRAEEVKRGVWQAGGFPLEMPAMSLGETLMKPTTMLYRNLLAMETEELLRSNPVDAVVLLGGCDKTVPGLVMGATSVNLPAIFVPAGPMLRGNWRGQVLGSGSDVWKYWADHRAGLVDDCTLGEIEDGIARSFGTCMTMGTASTMAAAVEALGLTLPNASSTPAADSAHARLAAAAGRRIVEMAWDGPAPRELLTAVGFDNAIAVTFALGGSTNAIIHLVAMAGRAGIALDLDRFDRIARRTPLVGNIRPCGQFLMEDFHYAGGLRALLARLGGVIDRTARTVTGSLGDGLDAVSIWNEEVILPLDRALNAEGGVAVLRGNLAPSGAVIKHMAAEPRLHRHTGSACVFRSYADLAARIDDPRPARHGRLGAGAAARRAARRPRNAGVGHAADSEEAARAGRARHGAHLGWPHERHRVRRLRAPRFAGVVRRRAARAREGRGLDRAGRPESAPHAARGRRRARAPAGRVGAARADLSSGVRTALLTARHAGRRGM